MKKFTGMKQVGHGTPWTAIEELDDKYASLLEDLIELSQRFVEIVCYVKRNEAAIKGLELRLDKLTPKKKPAKKTGGNDGSND